MYEIYVWLNAVPAVFACIAFAANCEYSEQSKFAPFNWEYKKPLKSFWVGIIGVLSITLISFLMVFFWLWFLETGLKKNNVFTRKYFFLYGSK